MIVLQLRAYFWMDARKLPAFALNLSALAAGSKHVRSRPTDVGYDAFEAWNFGKPFDFLQNAVAGAGLYDAALMQGDPTK